MRGMASFLTGLGGGYIQAKDKQYERDRQAKDDAWRDEQRGWQKSDRASAEADKQALKDATAERTTMQGTAVTDGAGNANLYADPAAAARAAEDFKIEAEMRGQSPATVMTAPATGVTGNMSKGHQIASGPVDVEALNSRDAKMGRVVGALMERGKPVEALGMENAVLENKSKTLGLKTEELKFADQMFNRKLEERLSETPNWDDGAAKILTETNVGSLAGVTVKNVRSADGKTVNFTATLPDGTEKVIKSYSAGPEGRKEFSQALAKVDVVTRIGWMAEQAKTDYQKGRDDKQDQQWQQTFDFNRKKEENDQQYRARTLAIQQAQEGRAAAAHRVTMESAKIPPGVKLRADSLAKQMESVGNAINKAMAEGQFDPKNPGTSKLIEEQSALRDEYRELLQTYIPGASQTNARPLGMPGAPVAAPAVESLNPPRPPAPPPIKDARGMNDLFGSVGRSLSGNSSAQITGIKHKIENGLPLSGTEQVIARENNLLQAR